MSIFGRIFWKNKMNPLDSQISECFEKIGSQISFKTSGISEFPKLSEFFCPSGGIEPAKAVGEKPHVTDSLGTGFQ